MNDFIASAGLTGIQWTGIFIAAVLIGLSRTAVSGFGMLTIPLLAAMFGGKASTGIILPMLVIADVYAITHFRRDVDRTTMVRLMPWALAGLAIGLFTGKSINDDQFKLVIGLIVLVCIGILIYAEFRGSRIAIPDNLFFSALIGVMLGFASMVGNAAGPILWIFLISREVKKTGFMGTSAWFFFTMNIIKLPLQIFVWDNITVRTVVPAVAVIPVILGAAYAGTWIIRKIKEKPFRYVVLGMTLLAALNLML